MRIRFLVNISLSLTKTAQVVFSAFPSMLELSLHIKRWSIAPEQINSSRCLKIDNSTPQLGKYKYKIGAIVADDLLCSV